MSAKVKAATDKVEAIVGKIADMVTSVELITDYTHALQKLDFTTATVAKDFTFLKFDDTVVEGAIEFNEGDQHQVVSSFVVRVSLTNAVLAPEMISLVNSMGENLNEMLVVDKVEKYDGILRTRGVSETGLWKVSVKLNEYNDDEFNAAAYVDPNNNQQDDPHILYSVQVNNTAASMEEARNVTSSYDLTLNKGNIITLGKLGFYVNGTPVEQIANRYFKSIGGKTGVAGTGLTNNDVVSYQELEWKDGKAQTSIVKKKLPLQLPRMSI